MNDEATRVPAALSDGSRGDEVMAVKTETAAMEVEMMLALDTGIPTLEAEMI